MFIEHLLCDKHCCSKKRKQRSLSLGNLFSRGTRRTVTKEMCQMVITAKRKSEGGWGQRVTTGAGIRVCCFSDGTRDGFSSEKTIRKRHNEARGKSCKHLERQHSGLTVQKIPRPWFRDKRNILKERQVWGEWQEMRLRMNQKRVTSWCE